MAEPELIAFTFREVVEALLKQQNIHEGSWMLALEFGLGASNIAGPGGESELIPAAIVPVVKIGIRKTTEKNNLTVDASALQQAKSGKKLSALKRADKI